MARVRLSVPNLDADTIFSKGAAKRITRIASYILDVTKNEGVRTLWRGNLANAIRYITLVALNFAFRDPYEG